MAKKYTADIIEATSITGSLLGTATLASALVPGDKTVEGDLTVTGKITAEEFHTEYVSSSIVYKSGSTKFGDSSDDVMSVTGSLQVQGSITGSLLGTATNAVSSSYAVTSSYAHFAATPTVQGVQGTQGIQGVQGLQGADGYIGVDGTQGTQGVQGTTGIQGTQGIQGIAGDLGGQGTQGTQGIQGITGTQGLQGRQGTTGTQGTSGTNGAQGTTGSQGTTGQTGSQGTTGTTGSQGATGQTGPQGTTGQTGSQGTTGQTGSQGTTGTQGIQGIQGIQGPNAGITSYTNASDNRVITSVSSTTINAEANLLFDGTYLDLNGNATIGSSALRLSMGGQSIGFNRRVHDGAIYSNTGHAYQFQHTPSTTNTSDYLALQVYSPAGTQVTSTALTINGAGAASFSNRIAVGSFPNSTTNAGEAWIGRAADRAAGTLTVQLGTGTGRKFEVVDYGWTTVEFSADDAGVATAAGSFRAPIFYDSNDTGYYLDPASSSNMVTVTATNYYQNANGYFQFGFTNNNVAQWPLVRFGPVDIAGGWDEGIIKAASTEGVFGRYGMGIHMNEARAFGVYSSGWNKIIGFKSDEVRSYQNFYAPVVNATTHLVAPLVYSGGGSVSFGNDLTVNGNYLKFDQSGTRSWSIRAAGGNLNFTSGDGSGTYTFTGSTSFSGNSSWFGGYGSGSGPGLAFENQGTFARIVFFGLDFYEWDYGLVGGINNGYIYSNTSFRAPIFYDSDNTGYYVNPSGGSYLRGVLEVTGGHYDTEIRLTANAGDLGSGVSSAMSWWVSEPNVTWNEGGFGYNVTNDAGTPGGFGRLNTSFGQAYMRFTTGGNMYFYNTNTSGTRSINMEMYSDGYVYANNYLVAGNSLRAPIFYDSNDTGYYLDPASSGTSMKVNGNIEIVSRSASWAEGLRIRTPGSSVWGGIRITRDRAADDGNWAIGFTGLNSSDDLTFYGTSNANGSSIRLNLTHGGTLTATGDIVAYSDRRVKENINPIQDALEKVKALRGVTYNRTDVEDKSEKIGVIAQEIQEILPQVVFEQADGMLGVSYGNISAVLIEAIKEQQTQIENQQSQIDELKSLVKQLLG